MLRQAQEAALNTQKHTLENIVTMNDALQDEMDLNVTNAIQWNGSGGDASGHDVIDFGNDGRRSSCFGEANLEKRLEQCESSQRYLSLTLPSGSTSIAS